VREMAGSHGDGTGYPVKMPGIIFADGGYLAKRARKAQPREIAPEVTDAAEGAARLAAIIDSSDDAIVSKTLDGVITSWNRAAERIFGYTAEEAVGQHITLIVPEERRAEEREVLARLVKGERLDHFETIRQTKDGRRVEVSLTVSPVRNATGRIVGASKVARDISDRRRLERERQELLEREREARGAAEALNRSKDQFLATLSHELRTPLNAIYGWARMLDAGRLDATATRRATEAILRNAAAQVQLIEDLFDVARVVTGNMRLDVRPLNIVAVLEAALDTVRPIATAKGVYLESVVDPRAGAMMGDPVRLQQVIWNLLSNAVKFTPREGRIEARLRPVGDHVEIVVRDTGEGIAPEHMPRLFQRFGQADSSSTRRHAGLGIGLSLVRHLVELHGGTVSADSAGRGLGATFTVILPVAAVLAPPTATASVSAGVPAPDPANPVSLRDLRILVVDDDADGLELASLVLVNAGAEVRGAPSPVAALAVLEDWAVDLLVTDLEMPGEDGVSLLRRARRMMTLRGRRLPALALTAYGRSEDRIRALAAGFNLHLGKPVSPAELVLAAASLSGRTG
jgi:PAS domain S-box-containing protein